MSKSNDIRKRLPNFCNAEKIRLVELIEKNQNFIENKKSDAINIKEKEKCWANICREFNSNPISGYRDVANLRNCWDNLKKKTRKHYAEIRTEIFKTGGGKMTAVAEDPIADSVKRIIEPSVIGLKNRFDNDYMPDIDDPIQCRSQLDDDIYAIQMLEEAWQSTSRSNFTEDLEDTESNVDDPLTYTDVQAISVQTNPCTSIGTSRKALKRKKSAVNFHNEQHYDLAKENTDQKNNEEIEINIGINTDEQVICTDVEASGQNMRSSLTRNKKVLKRKNQPAINSTKRNERYFQLAQEKIELIKISKEAIIEKTALEAKLLKLQIEKEELQIELLNRELKKKKD